MLPFAVARPRLFYRGVIVAQIVRVDNLRISPWTRLTSLTGMNSLSPVSDQTVLIASIGIPALVVLAFAGGWVVTRRPPPALDWFALATAAGVVAAFMWPADFYYHYSDFFAPFLALSIGLPVARLVAGLDRRGWRPAGNRRAWRAATAVAAAAIVAMAVSQVYHEGRARAVARPVRRGAADHPAWRVRAYRRGVLHDRGRPVLLLRPPLLAGGRRRRHRSGPQRRQEWRDRREPGARGAGGLAPSAGQRAVRVAVLAA